MRQYKQIEDLSEKQYRSPEEFESMKDFAEYSNKQAHPSILFSIKNNKDYAKYIWKTIKPEYSRPFKQEQATC